MIGDPENPWNEGQIARDLCFGALARKCVVMVDRCKWTGAECDVLAVTNDCRIIDIEIKISRSDFKADAEKYKWWSTWTRDGSGRYQAVNPKEQRGWPPKVWKHYFVMPADIWTDDLAQFLPSANSGVLLVSAVGESDINIKCHRRAKPNRDALVLEPKAVLDIARLANLRMWNAYARAGWSKS